MHSSCSSVRGSIYPQIAETRISLTTFTPTPSLTPTIELTRTPTVVLAIATLTLIHHRLAGCKSSPTIELGSMTLAFTADWDGDPDLYLIQGEGSNLRQLTDNDVNNYGASWSLDGESTVYFSTGRLGRRLYVSQSDGTDPRLVTSQIWDPIWYYSRVPFGDEIMIILQDDLYAVDIDDGSWINITDHTKLHPKGASFSPDGGLIAFVACISGPWPWKRFFLMAVDGSWTNSIDYYRGNVHYATWHPSERRMTFRSTGPDGEGF
ncbi:MAG: hypothetical protein GTO14_25250 [Anaerolineales bacterium]|nr:hypothetical protein [Anaerolineales bacterium]